MTSSLVGSEMCIRDRPGEGGQNRKWHTDDDRPRVPPNPILDACLMRQPVSYTHLTLPTICSV
eukprot:12018412-Prorocentrum_lima.AAC.1